ncbi:MAG: glycosyltransferase family 2 protein [Planctomycetes bacterium]|nr:glycosyltransferase family 2 protein [Planctomycetota bacterium]
MFPRAVASIAAQTYRPLEVVIVNDGSKDDTAQVAANVAAQYAGQLEIQVINQPNMGVAGASNTGGDAATGDFLAWLGDDDAWLPGKAEKQVAAMRAAGADAACSYITQRTANGDVRFPSPAKKLLTGRNPAAYIRGDSYAHICTLLVSREIWRQAGPYDRDLRISEDDEWIARVVHLANFVAVEEELAIYEFNQAGLSRVNSIEQLVKRDESVELAILRMRQRNQARPNWNEQVWRDRAAKDFDQIVKHLLYAGQRKLAVSKWRQFMAETQDHPTLVKTRRKLRKAWWLGLVGQRLKHPKFESNDAIRM